MNRKTHYVWYSFYCLLIILLFGYSYTQVDLNLTLSSGAMYQFLQQKLTFIGYFQRSLSGFIISILFLCLFIGYFFTIRLVQKKILSLNQLIFIIAVTAVLLFSYPAFSHDIFNYIFDARIVTKYHLNPTYFKALDFPFDEWTRFMRWTHRYYPYGPGWIIISILPSLFGLEKFVLTLLFFKLFFAAFHFLNCFLIYKILAKINTQHKLLGLTLYALNPLIIIESLISPHNEVVMLAFALLSFLLLLYKKKIFALIILFLSVSIKYISATLIPLYYFNWTNWQKFLTWAFFIWLLSLIPIVLQREVYSWYFIPLIGISALVPNVWWLQVVTVAITAGTIVRYIPFILIGSYTVQTQLYQFSFSLCAFFITGLLAWFLFKKVTV